MTRAASLLFSLVAYAIFFATFLYLIAFVGDLPIAAQTVDRGPDAPFAIAVLIDVALIALFGLQHSVMARQGFKRAWTRIVPEHLERSVYVLAASAALIVMFLLLAADPEHRLGRDRYGARSAALDPVRDRLADRPAQHLPDQSFRAVRAAAGLVPHARAGRPRRRSFGSPSSIAGSRIRSTPASSSPSGRRRR